MLKTYTRIDFADGNHCTCKPKYVPDMTEGETKDYDESLKQK